jgi:hypothetical protein
MAAPRLAVAAASKSTEPTVAKSAAMETSVEPNAMSEDEMVEVEKTVPAKEANSNDDDRDSVKPVRRGVLIQPSSVGQAIREVIGVVAVDVGRIGVSNAVTGGTPHQ